MYVHICKIYCRRAEETELVRNPKTCSSKGVEDFICKLRQKYNSMEDFICKLRQKYNSMEDFICKLRQKYNSMEDFICIKVKTAIQQHGRFYVY
jgi:hypothetical protein